MFQYFILELNHEDNYNTSVTHQILFLVGVVIGVIIFFLLQLQQNIFGYPGSFSVFQTIY